MHPISSLSPSNSVSANPLSPEQELDKLSKQYQIDGNVQAWVLEARKHSCLIDLQEAVSSSSTPELLIKGIKLHIALDILEFKHAILFKLSHPSGLERDSYSSFLSEENPDIILSEASNFSMWLATNEHALSIPWQLELDNVGLRHLPKEVALLTNLRGLNLSKNLLTALPEEVNQLEHLIALNLSNNKFTAPPKLVHQLRVLEFSGNPCTDSKPKETAPEGALKV